MAIKKFNEASKALLQVECFDDRQRRRVEDDDGGHQVPTATNPKEKLKIEFRCKRSMNCAFSAHESCGRYMKPKDLTLQKCVQDRCN